MSIKSVYTVCALFCLGACADGRLAELQPGDSPLSGESLAVNLALDVAPLSSPPSVAGTRSGGKGGVLQASFRGMEVELSGNPVAGTRALSPLEGDEVHSAIILQFDGTLPQSKCIQATYKEKEAHLEKLDLSDFSFKSTNSPISRIVAIANLPDNYPGLLVSEWNAPASNKTYADLLELHLTRAGHEASYPLYAPSVEGGSTPVSYEVMSGFTDVKLEGGKLVTVVLQRIFAKASFHIEINPELVTKYPIWMAQVSSIPANSYFLSGGRGIPFPTESLLGKEGYYDKDLVPATGGVFSEDALSAYLPVNLQPAVPTAIEQTRALLKPQNSTYLKIIGMKKSTSNPDINEEQVIYFIYLGANFTTDYSLAPNTGYNYTIRIKGEDDLDGTVVKFIPGYYGGGMQYYDENDNEVTDNKTAVKWRFKNKMELYFVDVPIPGSSGGVVQWSPMGAPIKGATSTTDGRNNTWILQGGAGDVHYAASYFCFNMNSDKSEENFKWYLPAIRQLVGAYLASSGVSSGLSAHYWSSTEFGNSAYFISKNGKVGLGKKYPNGSYKGSYLRAAKDLQ